jgi:TolB-like protein/DNA-binding winged helix-turn-helix (wHTH) protein
VRKADARLPPQALGCIWMSLPADSHRQLRLDEFELDLQTAELSNNGQRFVLQGQPFRVLTVLLERPGELVTREELKKRLWPSDTFVDFDHSLNKAVNRLREALHDPAEKPHYVETIPRRGYRFIATVRPVTVDFADRSGPVTSAPIPAPARRLSWPRAAKLSLIALSTVAVILVGSILAWRARSSVKTNRPVNIQSLAVLPLENLSGDSSQDYFADGMTDALITSLGQIRSLRVISRTSVMQYRGVHKPLPQIARELNVDAVVEGTVVRSSGQVRIAAELIQASTDNHLWSQSYERDLTDVLGLQHEIASAIAKQIRMTLTPGEQIRAGIKQPVNLEAYESYWRGEYFLNRATPDSLHKAADYFRQAIEKDPSYPPAYTELAAVYQILGEMGAIPPKVAFPKAKLLIAKALELDPQFASAHAALGWNLLDYDFDFAGAGAELQRAVELNPNGADGHLGLGVYYTAMGRLQESVQEVQRARELAPLDSIINTGLCDALYVARRYEEALAQCKANLDLDPSSPIPHRRLGAIYVAKAMNSEAASEFLRSDELGGASPAMIAALKAGARDSGLPGFWTAWLQFKRARIAAGKEEPMALASVYCLVGDTDKALIWLEKAFKARRSAIVFLGVLPAFDSLRSDPRFVSLLRRIGLPQSQTRN